MFAEKGLPFAGLLYGRPHGLQNLWDALGHLAESLVTLDPRALSSHMHGSWWATCRDFRAPHGDVQRVNIDALKSRKFYSRHSPTLLHEVRSLFARM